MIFDSPEANQRLSDTAAEAPPATFMERFQAADKQGQLRGTVLSPGFAVSEDYDRRIKDIKDAGLGDLSELNPMWNSKPTQRAPHVYSEGHSIYDMEPAKAVEDPHEAFQKKLEELAQKYPDKAHIIKADKPITGSESYQAAKKAAENAASIYGGPPLTGPIADFAGGMWSMRKDPFQIGTLVIGPMSPVRQGAKAVLTMGLKQAAANAAVEASLQPFVQSWRKSMNDSYGWWDAAEEIGMAGAFGLGADAGVRMLYRGVQARMGRKAILDEQGRVTGYESAANAAEREALTARNLEIQKNLEALPKDTFDKIAQGDEEATIALAKALKADEDPSVAGAINALRNTDRVTLDGIDDGWRERSLLQQLRSLEDPSEPAPVHFDSAAKAERPRLADDAELPRGTEGNQHYRMFELDGKPVRFESIDANRITTEPETFQFKGGRDAAGASNALRAVDFDGTVKGKVIVYEREDGSLVVADGHDRVSLANRAPEPQKLDALVFREKDGWTAEQVRAEAARKNIQEGTGSLMDVAGAIRRHPEIVDDSMAVSTDFMADARSIARLSDEAFDAVAGGQFNPKHGVLVSDHVPDQARHMEVLRELDRRNPPTEAAARREIGNMLREPANIETLARVMDIPLAEPHVLEARNDVLAGVMTTLRQEPGYIGEIETQAIAAVIRRLAEKPGLVSDTLAQAGRAVAEGQPIERAIDATLRRFETVIADAGVKGLADQPVRLASFSRDNNMQGATPIESIGPNDKHPGKVLAYHGSPTRFDTFDADKIAEFGFHFGSEGAASTARNKQLMKKWLPFGGNVRQVVLDIKNPITVSDVGRWDDPFTVAYYLNRDGGLSIDWQKLPQKRKGATEQQLADGMAKIKTALAEQGFDGIRYINHQEGAGAWSYIVWNKGQVTTPGDNPRYLFALSGSSADDLRQVRARNRERLERARSLGYDTDTVWYHGTHRTYDEVGTPVLYMTQHADIAGQNGPNVGKFFLKDGPKLDVKNADDLALVKSLAKQHLGRDVGDWWDANMLLHEHTPAAEKLNGNYNPLPALWADLRDRGYIGIVGRENKNDARPHLIVLDPKSSRSVDAEFDPVNAGSPLLLAALSGSDAAVGRSMRADLDRLGYYSKALEAAKSLKQAKGTPEQMLAQLKAAGVKDAEIEATNLRSFLDGKTSITRDEIVKHLTENRVGVNEVTRVTERARAAEKGRDYDRMRPDERDMLAYDQRIEKWKNYSLDPSNPTYRETVLHLPLDRRMSFDEFLTAYRKRFPQSDTPDAEVRGWYEKGIEIPGVGQTITQKPDVAFQSGHFSEPNIIGHMMTSMNRHEGKPVFTLDQIQSDWGQELRDGGVRDEAKIAALRAEFDTLKPAFQALAKKATAFNDAEIYQWARRSGTMEDERLVSDYRRVRSELATAEASTPGHPLVNTTDQWTNTTLRRALRQAVEADAEYIAIPHGDTVLSYNPGDEGGMRGFYGSRFMEGIVPKNLRKLLEKIDKDSAKPALIDKLETPSGMKGSGFTLFPLTDKVKKSILEEGQPLFAKPAENISPAKIAELAENLRQALDEATTPPPGRLHDPIKDAPKQVERLREDLAEDIAAAMGQPSPAQLAALQAYRAGRSVMEPSNLWFWQKPEPAGTALMFHATNRSFDKFDLGQSADFGIHFGTAKQAATRLSDTNRIEGGRTIPAEVTVRNAIAMDDQGFWGPVGMATELQKQGYKVTAEEWKRFTELGDAIDQADADVQRIGNSVKPRLKKAVNEANDAIKAKLNELGIDGIWYKNTAEGRGWSLIVWNEGQVKSATTGEQLFSRPQTSANPDILAMYERYVTQGREALDAVMPGTGRMIDEFVQANPEVVARIAEALGAPTGRPQAAQMLEQAMPQFTNPRIIDMSKPVLLTPEANARMREIRPAIDETVKMLPPEYRIRVEDSLVFNFGDGDKRLDGLHDGYEKLIYVSMAAGDPVRTSRHEVIHALRQSGLMKDEEFSALYKFADRLGLRKAYEIDAQYKEPYTQAYGNRGADFVEQLLREETVANMFSDYSLNGRRFGDVAGGGMVDRLIDMIVTFMKQVRDIMGGYGFRNVYDVFESIESGAMARRGMAQMDGADLASVRQPLDMSPEARKARAEQMGFDTATVWYHGTPDNRGIWQDGFKTLKERYGSADPDRVFFFAEKHVASTYADDRRAFDYQNAEPETIPVYLKTGKQKVVEWDGRKFRGREKDGSGFAIRDYIDQARTDGYDSVLIKNVIDTYNATGKPSTILAVFDPTNIRSVNATFDPAEAGSARLLADMAQDEPQPLARDLADVQRDRDAADLVGACRA